jgi:hypothetical protein
MIHSKGLTVEVCGEQCLRMSAVAKSIDIQ